jgi:hypothetical protein
LDLKLTIEFERSERDWKATLPATSDVTGYRATIAEAAQSVLDSLIVSGLMLHEKHQQQKGGAICEQEKETR